MFSKRTVCLAFALAASAGPVVVACSSSDEETPAPPADVDVLGQDAGTDLDATVRDAAPDRGATPSQPLGDAGRDSTVVADARADANDAAPDTYVSDASADVVVDASPDTGVDGGFADPGAPCATDQAIQRRPCGYCGTESRVCLTGSSDAGLVWQPWGECRGQVPSTTGCFPGTTRNVPCGLCGSQPQTCQNDCSWASAFCNQPATSVCAPDAGDYVQGLSCDAGGRIRYCKNDCTYGEFSACFDPTKVDGGTPAGTVAIALSTVSGTNKVTVSRSMPQSRTLSRLGAFSECPNATIGATTPRSYDYVVVTNPDSVRTAKVSIWTHPAATSPTTIDNIIAAYVNRTTPPTTDAERIACTAGVRDGCDDTLANDPTACTVSWAGLIDESSGFGSDDRVTLPPGQSAVIYVAGYGTTDYGDYQLSVRTEVLQ